MFIICFTNSNVDVRSCLVSLFGLSVALFSTVFYFCKVTDLASPLSLFFFILSFLFFLRCSRLHAVVTRLRVFVNCVGLKCLQPGSCFFPSLCLSSPALLSLSLITFSEVVNFSIQHTCLKALGLSCPEAHPHAELLPQQPRPPGSLRLL